MSERKPRRRPELARVSSPKGNRQRASIRAATMPTTTDKFRNGFTKPGSRNPRKVTR